jgi:uncharacterized protein YPO0396
VQLPGSRLLAIQGTPMDDSFFSQTLPLPGFRLHKLEVYNWGTFDSTAGEVHTVRPDGQITLLIGQNGSGKSTLVDALLTLLVRPVVRNYNVAAGAHKQERDERTYLKGAYGRISRVEDNHAGVQFLRPGGSHYSALLACFRNEGSDRSFTVAVLLYLNSEGRVEKVYCFAPDERSIAADCAGLARTDRLRQLMEKRGFRATTSYAEYHSWFVKATGVRPKAMDIFNQTVAVKDIHSLNRFIREHMLEAKPWEEKVDSLLNHFTLLSDAHQSLVRVRRQAELLEPLAAAGAIYREHAGRLEEIQRLLGAVDSFFRRKTIELSTAQCQAGRNELAAVRKKKDQLAQEIADLTAECRSLANEIDQAGGERLRQIPLLIRQYEAQAETRREANRRYRNALEEATVMEKCDDTAEFAAVRLRLPVLLGQLEKQAIDRDRLRDELVIERGKVSQAVREEEAELEALIQRNGNLPESLARLREQICESLRLPEKDLLFVAELIAVKTQEREWESSIEMVLRGFALSLLVPQSHYPAVSRYIDQTRLENTHGRGQRLVYFRVGERGAAVNGHAGHAQSLLRKLRFREGHPLLAWVRGELADRFDYRCCETLEEFQQAQGPAMTRQRHVKARGVRHEKDDRDDAADPRQFVLGWDNREKRRTLAGEVLKLRQRWDELDERIKILQQELSDLRTRQAGVRRAQEVVDFATIDNGTPEREVESLRLEKRKIEENDDTIRVLKGRLSAAESRQRGVLASRDEAVRTEAERLLQLGQGERLIANAESALKRREAEGALVRDAEFFAEIEACFRDQPLTAGNLFDQERAFLDARRAQVDRLRLDLDPLRNELGKLMNRFLRDFPDERADLEADPAYLDSFLALREQIRREDLPRHELRFKERLNEKVTQEIGLLHGAFQCERSEILAKIDLLNESLRQVEYRPGTHMRLEGRPVHDVEIAEFQLAMKECLAGSFEGTVEVDEARFVRIEKLIAHLRAEPRWREKVTDVRRWFDFAARELDSATGAERGCYEDSTGQSGGEKAKLAFTILVAAIVYQYDIDPDRQSSDRFHFVVIDEMFSKVDDQYAEYALELFRRFGLQLLIVAPLDSKALVTEPYVGCYLHVIKDARTNRSEVFGMSAHEFEAAVAGEDGERGSFNGSVAGKRAR